jgi:ArsR family transcriptional regulator
MPAESHKITDTLAVLADETRLRLLMLLDNRELTVAELAATTRLAQPRVSTHLARLKKAGLVVDRKAGVSSYYRLRPTETANSAEDWPALWKLLKKSAENDPLIQQDRENLEKVLTQRADSHNWVDSVAGDMERHYSPGRSWEATARSLACLLNLGDVLDIGCGDGVLAELIHRHVSSYTGIDHSETIVNAARKRLSQADNCYFQQGDMHTLPFEADQFDQVLMLQVLTYSPQPQQAIGEAYRVLRPGGRLLLTTLNKHPHQQQVSAFGHVNLGFDTDALRQLATSAGFTVQHAQLTSREQKPPHFEVITLEATK